MAHCCLVHEQARERCRALESCALAGKKHAIVLAVRRTM